jgi:hypothetical protein
VARASAFPRKKQMALTFWWQSRIKNSFQG